MTKTKPILCVDFDGVVHSYTSGWKGELVIPDPPTDGALRWFWKATEWFDVQIYSSRSKYPGGPAAMRNWMAKHAAVDFSSDHPMCWPEGAVYPITFAYEKPAAFLTIDDRAICFDGNWAELEPASLLDFKPWNKRAIGATGTFPMGKIDDDDEGALKLAVGYDSVAGIVRMEFGKPVAWMGLAPEDAIQLARSLLRSAGVKSVTLEI